MDSLCSRARSAMNLVLLLSLLQIWVVLTEKKSTLLEHVRSLDQAVSLFTDDELSHSINALRRAVKPLFGKDGTRAQQLQSVPLSVFVDVKDEDIDSMGRTKLPSSTNSVSAGKDGAQAGIYNGHLTDDDSTILHVSDDTRRQIILDDVARYDLDRAIRQAAAREHLHSITEQIAESNLPGTATLWDLDRRNQHNVEVPFVKESVEAKSAFWLISVGVLAPLLMLVSVSTSMLIVLQHQPSIEFADWILLYPSRSGYVLGLLWLALPSLALTSGIFRGLSAQWVSPGEGALLSTVLLAAICLLTAFVIAKARRVRKCVCFRSA